jgi:transcriptional antiterminator RfaH
MSHAINQSTLQDCFILGDNSLLTGYGGKEQRMQDTIDIQRAMNDAINSDDRCSWYAIHTKPCQEERTVDNLTAWKVETMVPWLEKRRGLGSRQPLFPSYIFARFDAAQMLHKISFTRGVSYVVSFGGTPAVIPGDIISTIRARMDEQGIVRIAPSVRPGDRVVIQAGPLQTFIGIFEKELTGNERIQILLTSVAFSARVEVPICDVAPAGVAKKI